MASLHVIRGRDAGQHFVLRGTEVSIGRESSNQIQLRDTEVSRQHARIVTTNGNELRLIDQASSNGTFVNSVRIKEQLLRNGDRVQVGRTLLLFSSGSELVAQPSSSVNIDPEARASDLSHIRKSIPNESLPAETLDVVADSRPSEVEIIGRSNWEVMYLVSQAVSRTVDIDDLLRQVLDLIFQWIQCDRGCIMLMDDVSSHLTPACLRDRKSGSAPERMRISRTILDYVINRMEGVLTSNAQQDERWDSAGSIASLGVLEAICVPMQGRYGTVGAIYVDTSVAPGVAAQRPSETASFQEEHLKLLIAIGNQAALAIEDTQFYRAMLQSERLAAMGQTIANLSHHVKNILQGMRGGSYLIETGLGQSDFETVKKGWRIVDRNQDRISNLVMDMLSFSKERDPDLQLGDLRETIAEVIDLLQTRATEANARIIWKPPEPFPFVRFDPEAMHRAIMNVVINAIDAVEGREGGWVKVWIAAQTETGQVEIHVEDNGEGIMEADIGRAFSVFESKKGARGTGLGLPVSRKTLREHGGDIDATSQPGKGTRFILRWPGLLSPSESPTLSQ